MTLITNEADVNYQDKVDIDCMMTLTLHYTSYVSIQNEWTPLLVSSHQGHTDVIELLIKHGAQLNIKNKVHYFATGIHINYYH